MTPSEPEDRMESPVGAGGLRLLRTKTARTAAWSAVAAVIVGIAAMIVKTSMDFKGPASKPEDTGATKIAQAVPDPPVPEPSATAEPAVLEPAASTQPLQPRQLVFVDPPATLKTEAPAVVASAPVNYVRFPTAAAEGFFDVPSRQPEEKRPDNPAASAVTKVDAVTSVAYKSVTIEGGQAGAAIDYTYKMLPQHIPCALDVAMDSTLAGSISCHTRVDVLSPMHVLLMPAGTLVEGEYKSDVQTGQQRLFAFVGAAYTPEGIPVPLNSEVADSLGRNGIAGEVDNHYPERFGASLMLNVLDSATQIAQAEVSKGGNQYFSLNSGGSGGGFTNLAGQILQQQASIKPTIYVQPGTVITLVVSHIIDFSHAIKVSTK
jgi:type IV secretory pathway VirB10-like protein